MLSPIVLPYYSSAGADCTNSCSHNFHSCSTKDESCVDDSSEIGYYNIVVAGLVAAAVDVDVDVAAVDVVFAAASGCVAADVAALDFDPHVFAVDSLKDTS